jgi:hypothetical protein
VVQRFYKIIVALLFSCKIVSAQAPPNGLQRPSPAASRPLTDIDQKPWYALKQRNFNKIHIDSTPDPAIRNPFRLSPSTMNWQMEAIPGATTISRNYYTQHFGFFCRQELKVEKASGLPLRFRLGSLKECDLIEGK